MSRPEEPMRPSARRLSLWWLAARPSSLFKVALPVGVGASIGAAAVGELRPGMLLAALLFAWLVQLQIIFFNDVADANADTLHQQRFPALIDARAVPNGWLSRRALLIAGWLVVLALAALTMALARARALAPLFGATAVVMLWIYSYPPVRLNFRGLGELVETAGVGGVLPLAGYYFYTGDLALPLWAASPVLLLALSSSLTSHIKHAPADLVTGKKTAVVLFGVKLVRVVAMVAVMLSVLLCAALAGTGVHAPLAAVLTVLAPAALVAAAVRWASAADHLNLVALKRFKAALNRAVYVTNLGIIASFVFSALAHAGRS